MKKRAIPTLLLLSLFFMLSCSKDFTLLAPHSERNVENFYQTAEDFEIAVNGIYDALQSGGTYGSASDLATGGTGGYWMMTEMRSDNTDQGGDISGLAAFVAYVNNFTEDPLSEYVLGAWVGSYQGIARANVVLTRIADVGIDQDLKDQFIGEALFLRSLFYYNVAMLWAFDRDLTQKSGGIPLILAEPESINEELEQVDCETVLNQLVDDLTEAVAKLPDVHPSTVSGRATKGAAQALLGKIYLTLGNASAAETVLRAVVTDGTFDLVDTPADLWGPANELNVESMFESQFKSGGIGEGNGLTGSFAPSRNLIGGFNAGGRNRPTYDLINTWEPGDLRFKASMDTMYSYFDADTGDTVIVTDTRYIKKYLSVPFAEGDADNNFIVLRYADVLLMLAEALGEGTEAYDLINQVRNRAGLASETSYTDLGYASFEDFLLHERRVELAFENHRWYDLLRFGKALDVITAHFATEPPTTIAAPDEYRMIAPIPQREVDLGLVQNPGY